MGQMLIVQGPSAEQVDTVFARALFLFESLASVQPTSRLKLPYASIATFSPRHAASAGIFHEDGANWSCNVGEWVVRGGERRDAMFALRTALTRGNAALAKAVEPLDGSFCFALGNGDGQEVRLISDVLGRYHVYWAELAGCRVVSTSSLILAALIQPEWEPVSVREFLATGYLFELRTLFRGIEKLPPASIVTCRADAAPSISRYWRLSRAMYDEAPAQGDVPTLAATLDSAMADVFRGYERPLLDLTGGFDSRIMLAAALRVDASRRFSTVVNGKGDDPDVIAARGIAETFGLSHEHGMRDDEWPSRWWRRAKQSLSLCDGEYDVLEYAGILDTHDALARRFGVSVNGSGGEICRGYWWELLIPHVGRRGTFDAGRVAAKRFSVDSWGEGLLDGLNGRDTLTDHFTGVIARACSEFETSRNTACMDNIYLSLRMQRWQGRIASSTSRIWPCISPFMFKAPMEVALSSPPRLRRRGRMARELVAYMNPDLAVLPMAGGYPAMPIRWNTAHRFGPLLSETAVKVRRRLLRGRRQANSETAGRSVVHDLWREPEVHETLQAREMLTEPLYRRRELEAFLISSQRPGFNALSHFGRIVTLELLARAIRRGAR